MIAIIIMVAMLDIAGRIVALIMLMQNGNVKKLQYRTWVLLCAFVNFAWVAYLIMGMGKKDA
ncbi:MAG: hypothetical protein RR576_04790 [Oscillospiraceae bacterium]